MASPTTTPTSFHTRQTPHHDIVRAASYLVTRGSLFVPNIDDLHAPIPTAPLGCVIGSNRSARAITNGTHALRGDVEVLDEIIFHTLDTLLGEHLILACRSLAVGVAFELDAVVGILWPGQDGAKLIKV